MSTIIKIKRSSAASQPGSLGNGELAYTYGTGTSSNSGDRLFIGTGTETAGAAANIEIIGGKYFTDLLDHAHGTVTASSALIVDSDSKLDTLKVANLQLDGNTLSSTLGNLLIQAPSGSKTVITALYIDSSTSIQEYIEDITSASITAGDGISATYDDTAGTTTIAVTSIPNSSLDNSYFNISDGSNTTTIDLGSSFIIQGTTNETTVVQGSGTFTVGLASTISGLTSLSATTLVGTLTTAAQPNITSVGVLNGLTIAASQTVSMGSNRITNVTDPTGAQDAATKQYVDATVNGLDVKESVKVATTGDIGATYSNNVLTATSNGVISIDGVQLSVSDRLLVKDQTDNKQNGIYKVTTVGSPGSSVFVITRSDDANAGAKLTGGAFFFVEHGTDNGDNGYVTTHNGTPTLGTNPITFAQFSGAGQISAGAGMTKTGNTLDVEVDGSSIEIVSDTLQVKASGITNAMLGGLIDLTTKVTGTLPVGKGGTGATSLTANRLMIGNGTGAITVLASGTAGQVLMSNGSSAPTFADVDGGSF